MTDSLAGDLRFNRPLRVLSLDGGGVRGISPLLILKEIMKEISQNHDGRDVKPCQYFDLIGGTNSGGLIAIMLGRLGWTVDKCIEVFTKSSADIFKSSATGQSANITSKSFKYSASTLETVIKEVVKDEGMQDRNPDHCPAFVVAVDKNDVNGPPVIFRTYPAKDPSEVSRKTSNSYVWQACCATSAAPSYFPPFVMESYTFLDGGMGHNNPVFEAVAEASHLTSSRQPVECLVSIGTGTPGNKVIAVGQKALKKLARTAHVQDAFLAVSTDAEKAHQDMAKTAKNSAFHYLRFNPPGGDRVKIDHAQEMGNLTKIVNDYLRGQEALHTVKVCANILAPSTVSSSRWRGDGPIPGYPATVELSSNSTLERVLDSVVTSTKNIALDRIEVEPSPTGEMCIQFRPVLSRHVTGGDNRQGHKPKT